MRDKSGTKVVIRSNFCTFTDQKSLKCTFSEDYSDNPFDSWDLWLYLHPVSRKQDNYFIINGGSSSINNNYGNTN